MGVSVCLIPFSLIRIRVSQTHAPFQQPQSSDLPLWLRLQRSDRTSHSSLPSPLLPAWMGSLTQPFAGG